MKETQIEKYLSICIKYRFISLALSTFAYIFGILYYKMQSLAALGVVCGTIISCLVGNYLYVSFNTNKTVFNLVLSIEVFAYGIFIFLSGGFLSPYITYYIGCILISLDQRRNYDFNILTVCWCLVCSFFGNPVNHIEQIRINIIIGMIIVIIGFTVLRHYLEILQEREKELEHLNKKLATENQRRKDALVQMSDMYEGFGLMAMTDREQIVMKLASLITGNISPGGCMFVERSMDGKVVNELVSMIDESSVRQILDEVSLINLSFDNSDLRVVKVLLINGKKYEFIYLTTVWNNHIFLVLSTEILDSEGAIKKNFYVSLSETVFRALDTQGQIENYIAADEKNRIADEIHDTVIQKLFGLSCSLGELKLLIGQLTQEEISVRLGKLQKSATLTMKELRETIYGRSFEKNGRKSFSSQLKNYIDEVCKLHNINIETNIDPKANNLTPAQKIVIYRISCEAINNAVRHGGADNVYVKIEEKDSKVYLSVEDDGKGFDDKKQNSDNGHGLYNMYHMATLLKGKLYIGKGEAAGVRIDLVLPVKME